MSTFRFFLEPERTFGVLAEVHAASPFQLALRRFENAEHGAVIVPVLVDSSSALRAQNGNFTEGLITISGKPWGESDFGFMSRAAAELLVLTIGYRTGDVLTMSSLRPLAKRSSADPLYKRLRKALGDTMKRGMVARGKPFKDICFGTEEARRYTLKETPSPSSAEYRPMAS